MKRNLFLIAFMALFASLCYGQTPQTYFSFTGGNANSFPFNTNSGNRIQWLFLTSNLTGGNPLTAGNITDIYIKPNTTSSSSYTNLTIKLGTTSITAVTASWINTGLVTVLGPTAYSMSTVSGQWYKIHLTNPFYYDGTSNLLLEISQTGYSGGFTINQTSLSPNHRIYGSLSSTAPTGSDGYLPNFGFDLAPANCSGTPNGGAAVAAASQIDCHATTTLSLSGNSIGSTINYQWQANDGSGWVNFGTDTNTLTTPPVVSATQFRCMLTCTSPGGGSAASTPVTVTVSPIPVFLGDDTTLCQGTTQTLDAGHPGADYTWNTAATSEVINVNTPGTYSVLVTDTNGCTGSDTILITPGVQPVNNLSPAMDLCDGSSIVLDAGNSGSDYTWNNSETSQAINVSSGGNYSVMITSPDGCTLSCSTNVTLRSLPVVDLGVDTGICPNAFLTLNAGNPGADYLWNTTDTTQTIPTTDSGTYSVMVTNEYGCTATDDKHISFLVIAHTNGFNFIPLFDQQSGEVKFEAINPVDAMTYRWDFGDGTPVSTDTAPVHIYQENGVYNVTLNVGNGCGETASSLKIQVDLTTGIIALEKGKGDIKLYPNPTRDLIFIENKNNLKMQEISVFNTLGRVVYRKKLRAGNNGQSLDVSALPDGIYSARILTDKGWIVNRFEIIR